MLWLLILHPLSPRTLSIDLAIDPSGIAVPRASQSSARTTSSQILSLRKDGKRQPVGILPKCSPPKESAIESGWVSRSARFIQKTCRCQSSFFTAIVDAKLRGLPGSRNAVPPAAGAFVPAESAYLGTTSPAHRPTCRASARACGVFMLGLAELWPSGVRALTEPYWTLRLHHGQFGPSPL